MSKRNSIALGVVLVLVCAALALFISFRPRNFWQVFHTEIYEITRVDAYLSSIDGTTTRQVTLAMGDPALDQLLDLLTDQSYTPDRFHGGGGSLEMDPYVYLTLCTDDGRPPRTLSLYGEQTIDIDGTRYIPSHAVVGQEAIRDLLLEQAEEHTAGKAGTS